jgi:CheY-like chemotaxis protein
MSKILIVEDEEAIADLEKDYLELSGFEVEVANDGETGLKKALENDYDLFILDLMLPGVDLRSADRFEMKKIRRLLWFRQKRMTLTKSEDLVLEQTIISQSRLALVS